MKNYYHILGVRENATQAEITDAYYWAKQKCTDKNELRDIEEAYYNLGTVARRKTYDKEMFADAEDFEYETDNIEQTEELETPNYKLKISENAKEFFKKNKTRLIAGTLVVGGLVVGYLIGKATIPDTNTPQDLTSTTSDTNSFVSSEAEKNDEQQLTEPALNSDNFSEKVEEILLDNQNKGLDIDPTFIKSALFITNIDVLTQEDIKNLYGTDLNIIEEIQNMYNYTSAVGTHNNNVALNQKQGKYIKLSDLAYDEEDKMLLQELDVEFVNLVDKLNKGEMTNEEYQMSFEYIKEFYTGFGNLNLADHSYSIYSLTSGGGLLAEQYWPMFSVKYASSDFLSEQNQLDIKSLSDGIDGSDAVVNGSRWLGAIVNHESLNCLDEEADKTLTKTQ